MDGRAFGRQVRECSSKTQAYWSLTSSKVQHTEVFSKYTASPYHVRQGTIYECRPELLFCQQARHLAPPVATYSYEEDDRPKPSPLTEPTDGDCADGRFKY